MARVRISPEDQMARINRIVLRLKEIETLSPKELVKRPAKNKWSVAEVIEHMYKAYSLYADKLNSSLKEAASSEEAWDELNARSWVSLLLKNFRPKKGLLKMKMKTQKVFEPKLMSSKQNVESLITVFTQVDGSLEHLRQCAVDSRTRQIESIRFSSAIGPIIRFNVSEAIEFILRHNERHMFQIERMLDSGYDGYFSDQE
jgi:hypothetical protein